MSCSRTTQHDRYEYAPAYSEGPVVPTDYRWLTGACPDPVTGRDAGEEDCIQRTAPCLATQTQDARRESGYLKEKRFGTKLGGGGGSVTLENHGQVRTLREVRTKEERYVLAASYSQPRDLRESRREIRWG